VQGRVTDGTSTRLQCGIEEEVKVGAGAPECALMCELGESRERAGDTVPKQEAQRPALKRLHHPNAPHTRS
jgi:hypothetical protein